MIKLTETREITSAPTGFFNGIGSQRAPSAPMPLAPLGRPEASLIYFR
jgi:hypothetical protein